MTSIDTNILFYALAPESSRHAVANGYLCALADGSEQVLICELVLAELYVLLRNPKVMAKPLSAGKACDIIQSYRRHPRWRLVENAPVMVEVWKRVHRRQFARRRLFDIRLALTLQHHGVDVFATANPKDFHDLGFSKIVNPVDLS